MAEDETSGNELLTLEEAAAYLRVSRPLLRELVRNRTVPVVELGPRARRFRQRALDTWLDRQAEASVAPKPKPKGRRR
jgi:excisionase family DNA binding protein